MTKAKAIWCVIGPQGVIHTFCETATMARKYKGVYGNKLSVVKYIPAPRKPRGAKKSLPKEADRHSTKKKADTVRVLSPAMSRSLKRAVADYKAGRVEPVENPWSTDGKHAKKSGKSPAEFGKKKAKAKK